MTESLATNGTTLPATVEASPSAIANALPRLRALAENSNDPAELRHTGALARGMKETAKALGISELHADLSWIEETALRRLALMEPAPVRNPDGTLTGVRKSDDGAMSGAERERMRDARSRHAGIDDAQFEEIKQRSLLDNEPATPRRIREAAGQEPATRPKDDRLAQLRRALDLLQKGEPAEDLAGLDDDERAEYAAIGALFEAFAKEMRRAAADRAPAAPEPEAAPAPKPAAELVTRRTRDEADASRKRWPAKHTLTGETWHAYGDAYKKRYGVDPVWNGTVAGQVAQFVKRLGRLAAPKVAGFYLQREDRWYREKMHPVGALLNDAEKLHTAWQTGQRASVDTRPDPMDAARVARERREARERAAR